MDNKVFFKIFNFDKIEYKSPGNSFYFFKFIWTDVRRFIKEYLELELVRNTNTKNAIGDIRVNIFLISMMIMMIHNLN
tara:strand:+ start:504 stop:737 length:234 start_codon:yes stop_codon:yes gene_type:complete